MVRSFSLGEHGQWPLVDGWWPLIENGWWLLFEGWWLMASLWLRTVGGLSFMMENGWWPLFEGEWLMASLWWRLVDGLFLMGNGSWSLAPSCGHSMTKRVHSRACARPHDIVYCYYISIILYIIIVIYKSLRTHARVPARMILYIVIIIFFFLFFYIFFFFYIKYEIKAWNNYMLRWDYFSPHSHAKQHHIQRDWNLQIQNHPILVEFQKCWLINLELS